MSSKVDHHSSAMVQAHSPSMQETKARLAGIFKKIGDKATTERGLEELWQFQKDLPEVDINPHLAKTSPQFRSAVMALLLGLVTYG